jgi:hypothetical protein
VNTFNSWNDLQPFGIEPLTGEVWGLEALRGHIRRRRAKRLAVIRRAIETDRCHLYPEAEAFGVLTEMVEETVLRIAHLTNRRLRAEHGVASAYVVKWPDTATREAFADINASLDVMSFEEAIGAMAFMLKTVADQVRRLRQRTLVFPVGVFLGNIRDGQFDVRLDRRRFTVASKSDAVRLLCDVFNDIREELPAIERMDKVAGRP